MIIRQVQTCDWRDLPSLLNTAFGCDYAPNFDRFEKWIMTPNQYTFVGFYDKELVATQTITIEHKLIHNYELVAHSEDLAVLREYQNKGFANRMMEYAIEFCKQKGVYKILCTCKPELVEYHKKHGFKVHEISLRRDI